MGGRLKDLRERAYLTQEDLARKTHITVATVSRIERGERQPRVSTIRKLARALGIKPAELMEDEPMSEPMTVAR